MDDFDDLIEDGLGLQEDEEDYEDQFVEHYPAGASKRPLAEHSGNVPYSSAPPGNAAKRAKASASSGQQEQQPPVGSARTVSGLTAMDDSEVADDLMAEINDLGGSFRLSAVSRRLYESASGASLPSQPNQGRSIPGGGDGHQESGYTGGYSETQTQLSQDMEDALAESLAEEAAAVAEAASAWLLPARSSIDFPGDVMSVTAQSDERVYCQVRDPSQVIDLKAAAVGRRGAGGRAGQLLSRPIRDLMIDAEERSLQRTLRRSAEDAAAAAASTPVAGAGQAARQETELWVDKYSPKSFLELLSDEVVNRSVVRWLKSWDVCVFGGDPKVAAAGRGSEAGSTAKQRGESRPEQRILLISGAPGLGKTTLAHVVAKHCGYRPVEINASDDRSAGALTSRIQNAAQMQSVVGDRRPNCIILDEIDGAAGGAEGKSAVLALIKLVQGGVGGGGSAKEGGGDGEGDEPGKRKRRKGKPLCRPIICVCNDLYAQVMRPLRDVAAVFQFKQPLMERLISRMRHICLKEKLFADRQALTMLAERTECDVRSCLNTLQFLARKQRTVRAADVEHQQVGQKDITRSAFAVWQELFWLRGNKRALRSGESRGERTGRLFGLLMDFGESELMLAGCHENMLGMRFMDTNLTKLAAMSATLGDADVMQRAIGRTMDFGIMKYLPAAVLSVAAQAAGPERVQLQWPKAITESKRSRDGNSAALRDWLAGTAPAILRGLSLHTAVQEVLPALLPVLAPRLRPVAERLLNPEERASLATATDTMLAYGVRFDQRACRVPAAATGGVAAGMGGRAHVTHVPLNPPVDRICAFQGLPMPGRPVSEAVQQMISTAVQMEAIRRREEARGIAIAPVLGGSTASSSVAEQREQSAGGSVPVTVSQMPIPLTVAERAKAAAVLMGRGKLVEPKRPGTWLDKLKFQKEQRQAGGRQQATAAPGQPGSKARPTVLYRFKEGYTNAVKRIITMEELM